MSTLCVPLLWSAHADSPGTDQIIQTVVIDGQDPATPNPITFQQLPERQPTNG